MLALTDRKSSGSKKPKQAPAKKGKATSAKDLQKLRRMDLLELLLDEIRLNEKQSATVTELTDLTERLKAKLDDKDEQIERLKAKLDDKDEQIAKLEELNKQAARRDGLLDLEELRAVEQRAIESYLDKLSAKEASE